MKISEIPIYFSTGGEKQTNACEFAKKIIENGYRFIELSGGMYDPLLDESLKDLLGLNAQIMLHNYFPPAKNPFVMNLASENFEVIEKSMSLAQHAIQLSKQVSSHYYAIHAGFLFDPQPADLGNVISRAATIAHERGLEIFAKNVLKLYRYAEENEVCLLVENNVISGPNLQKFDMDPFLLTGRIGILEFTQATENKVGILMDLGHWKVSSRSLGFDAKKELKEINGFIKGYHLSENNGITDQHQSFDENAWFLDELEKNVDFVTLEIHTQEIGELISAADIVKKRLAI
jgi:sugar phosphate isomerase/epimerase